MELRHRTGSIYEYRDIPVNAPIAVHEAAITWIRSHVSYKQVICDIGCGAGAFAQRLLDNGYENVVAVDEDFGEFRPAGPRRYVGDIVRLSARIREEVIPACVVALEVIEHTTNPIEFLKALRETGARWILVSFPNLHEAHNLYWFATRGEFGWWNRDSYDSIGHRTIMVDWLFEKHCEHAGLRVTERMYLDPLRVAGLRSVLFSVFTRLVSLGRVGYEERRASSVMYVCQPAD